MKQSKKWTLNVADVKQVGKNALIFSAPALVIFLTTLETGGSWEEALVAIKVWGLSTVLDLLRKLSAGK